MRQTPATHKRDREAFEALGLVEDPDSYTVQDVDACWRQLRSQLHPDKPGGSAGAFDAARKAYEAARYYTLQEKPCTACDGEGRIVLRQQTGFGKPFTQECRQCQGSGKR